MDAATRTGISGVRTVAVPVSDQDRAVGFYVERLGFEVRMDAPLPELGGRWIEVAAPGSATTLALIPAREDAPAGADTGIRLSAGDPAALHRDLQEHSVDAGELLVWDGVPPMFTLRDPDGNQLVVVG